MIIEQIYTRCLSQGAYFIESNGEVGIIDPLRETTPYIEKAKKNNAKIKYIFETHFHADFVSGHVTLAKETGATIVYGPLAKTSYDSLIAKDQQEFKIGEITLTVLHTPGHTMESTTYLLRDAKNKDIAIFSGDTLFLGDVGRPDLAQKAADMTQEDLAGILFDSLREKIMPLADDVFVYPAHGAGSACGKNLSKETVGTIGDQKKTNYALRADMTKEEFVKEVTNGLLPPPQYFPLNVKMNKEGYTDIDKILENGTKPLTPEDFEVIANETNALILDVRHQDDFTKGHIPKSIFIGIDGDFAPWVGAMIGNVKQPILLVTPKGREKETITRLSRVGFDQTLGYLNHGIEAWSKAGNAIDTIDGIKVTDLKALKEQKVLNIFDVRKPGEYASEHLDEAHSTPLSFINDYMDKFPENEPFYLHCAGGYRSVIAASILKSRGIHNLIDVKRGFAAIKNEGMKISEYICPSKL
ncbi:MBL fold metallo-hydrolase [Flavobacteriaceae bacterium]|nr:MBL fold metallo-hydrolase [Flavobacteriaceae bacterium]MDC0001178.1 MBL fold metallo-hydrolase [Flavobacteriaceae bacterium]